MLKKKKFSTMFYVSEAKPGTEKADVIRHYHLKLPPEILMTPLLTTDHNGYQATFQEVMKLTIIIGQFFGLNPVIGVSEADTSKLRFQIQSFRFAYSLLSIIGQCTIVIFCCLKLFTDSHPNLSANSALVFCITNCVTTILFVRVAMRWPKLCQHISKTEASDPVTDRTLIKKCKVSCVLVLTLAILEHVLSDLSLLAGIIDCQIGANVYEAFAIASSPWVFQFTGYTYYMAIYTQIISIQFTFNWNFSDVFVICVSFYLTSRLEQVNRRIEAVFGKPMMRADDTSLTEVDKERRVQRVSVWKETLENGSLKRNVTKTEYIGSIGPPLRYVYRSPVQEVHRPFRGYEQTVYFVYSFGFLITRSLAVSLIASRVHSASREPAHTLYFVPSSAYSVEVQRFLDQIHGDTIALSGLNFFNVKRGLVLTIAGTIVTYELVLMQFTGVTPTPPPTTITVPMLINASKV